MITALVQFKLPKPMSVEQAREVFLGTAPRYRDLPGLVRKYYVLSEDGGTAGGVYLWRSRADAEQLYTQSWRDFILEKYGAVPTVTYFDCPVVVDNVAHEIVADG